MDEEVIRFSAIAFNDENATNTYSPCASYNVGHFKAGDVNGGERDLI